MPPLLLCRWSAMPVAPTGGGESMDVRWATSMPNGRNSSRVIFPISRRAEPGADMKPPSRQGKRRARKSRSGKRDGGTAGRGTARTPSFIAQAHRAVRPMLKRSVRLPAFLSQAAKGKRLKPAERRRLVAQALLLFEGFYVHLPQKRAMYA